MEVAAPVPVKFKRRNVFAVRDFPKGCGPSALPVAPKQSAEQPPAVLDHPVKPSESEEISKPDIPNGLSTAAAADSASPDQVEPLGSLNAPKQEPAESAGPAEAVKPVNVEASKGTETPAPEAKEAAAAAEGKRAEGLPQQVVKLEAPELSDQLELSKGSFDQPELSKVSSDQVELSKGSSDQLELLKGSFDQPEMLVTSAAVKLAVKQCYSKKYPPPKRRKASAVREFPAGCGRNTPQMIREGSLEVAAPASSPKSKSSDEDKEPVLNQQLAVDAPTEKAEMEVKRDESKKTREVLEETSDEARLKSPSASLKIKSSDWEKKPTVKQLPAPEGSVRVTSTEKAQGEASRNDAKQIREKTQEISDEARAKPVSKSTLSENTVEERSEKKILVRSTSGKKLEGRDVKQVIKSLPIKEARESKPSPDSKSQSGIKLIIKVGNSLVRKPIDKGLKKHQTDAKVIKRKFPEEAENKGLVVNEETKGDWALKSYGDRMIVQALMAAQNCPWRQGRKSGGFNTRSVTPKNMKKEGKPSRSNSAFKGASASRLKNELAAEDEEDSDEENEKALTVYKRPLELTVTVPPLVPPNPYHKGSDNDEVSDRNKVKRALRLYQLLCRKLLQGEESKSKDSGRMNRVDLKAASILKEKNEWVNTGKAILGHVPGVEVGDEFHYRVELSIIGLHRLFQAGIDFTKKDGMVLATSIVASGGYSDDMDSSDVLIYSGSGGNTVGGDKQAGDQKLERGNLALKNSIDARTPVRVIHGFKELKGSEHDAKAKTVSTFTYDGLYVVENYWTEKGPHGFSVFKFQLRRMAGQPELALKEVKRSKKAKVREGLCIKDISEGKENIPICAVNTIDDDRPAAFKYITENIYPSWYIHTLPKGCDCTDGCLDSEKCACAVKNGGEIPFNYNGAIVQAKPLVYECGPSCKCPPSCYNRVSQHGIKTPLEIFKTKSRGWGVRSLYSIPSGSFICEYIGELLKDSEAEQRSNDEYLFDIGHNYEDKTLWEGLPSLIPGLQSSSVCETVEDVGFTIDAAEYGNVGRFINHSCSPNIYAQNVLYDHDDKRMPHIMFFAADNIPPLQELTYHYNYTIDQVRDSEGNIKRKNCYCGSPECTGRLY